MSSPGRFCPIHYRYSPESFSRAPQIQADTLLIAGGLYGNLAALDGLHRLVERDTQIVFNGDFNWFNVDPTQFKNLNEQVLTHTALRGNVETELRQPATTTESDEDDAGCGCAYPLDVDDALVERSNVIMRRLRGVASQFPDLSQRLSTLPMHLVAQVGDTRIAIVHGDAQSLAGWEFSHTALHSDSNAPELTRLFAKARVDVFASSHTCLPALRKVHGANGEFAVINNGAAGMPNFSGSHFGLVTRISVRPCPPTIRLYGTRIGRVFVDAVKLHYDHVEFVDQFLSDWPRGTAGHESYFSRLIDGPDFSPRMALGDVVQQDVMRYAV